MKRRLIISLAAFFIFIGVFYDWYSSIPPLFRAEVQKTNWEEISVTKIGEKYASLKNQDLLLYWTWESPKIQWSNIQFTDWAWIIRAIDPTGSLSFSWPNNVQGSIKWIGTVFIDFKNNLLLSIDALVLQKNNEKILPSFFIQENKKMFYDLADVEGIIWKELWNIYKTSAQKDEKQIFNGFSDNEIKQNIHTILAREPDQNKKNSILFKKDTQIREILEEILKYMENTQKNKKCGESSWSCIRFINSKIEEGEKIDEDIFLWLKEPLIMWAKKNNNPINSWFTWESIFQKYHSDVLSGDRLAVNTRDSAILSMIRSSQNPTYEMWLYLTFILSKEKKWSPYSLQIMTEMVRLGNALEKKPEYRTSIVEESNRALSNLRKVLEESYFDKQDDYLFVLKKDLKDEKWQKIDTIVFVNDLNQLIAEIDKSNLFLEYPDFRILRRHLSWFTCIFQKNKEYLEDVRVCRSEL